MKTAPEFLLDGAKILEERGKQYDTPGGERSMGRTVTAFNAITGQALSEAHGWLLMQLLKDVRQWQNPSVYHSDSAVDGVNYAALKAEALSRGAAAEWPEDDERIENIGRNGGEPHYAEVGGWIEWADGQCPVAPDTVVDFIMRNGDECLEGCRAFDLVWGNYGISCDIIFYRIHRN